MRVPARKPQPPSLLAAYTGLAFTADSQRLVTVDSAVGWWDVGTGKPIALHRNRSTHPRSDRPIALSKDGLTLVVVESGTYSNSDFSVFRLGPIDT